MTNFEQSNKADWIFDITATDDETGTAIDFSTALAISFSVKDSDDCVRLTASLANGKLTLPVSTTIEIHFTASDLANLCPGNYEVGAVYEQADSVIVQLLSGVVTFFDGVAKI